MTAEPRRRSSWAAWIAGALVLLPVLYVASIGPVFRWSPPGSLPFFDPSPLTKFYAPLKMMAEHYPWAGKALAAYLNLWQRGTGRKVRWEGQLWLRR
jgi:hypothetical protein